MPRNLGGARPGAGRPTIYHHKRRRTLTLSDDAMAVVKARSSDTGWTVSDALEDIIRQAGRLPRRDRP